MAEFTLPKNSKIQKGKHFAAPAGAKSPRTFKGYRWNPDDGLNPRRRCPPPKRSPGQTPHHGVVRVAMREPQETRAWSE